MIRHVLFDADGVLQDLPGGWVAAMATFVGDRAEQFLLETWEEEKPSLAGQGDYLPLLAARLEAYDVAVPAEKVYVAVWETLEVDEASLAIVRDLRERGFGVHLGTNQQRYRKAYMRETLGYDDLFDVSCYSCDLGVAKPDHRFFTQAAALVGDAPSSILFIDDKPENVAGARATGMAAECWHRSEGHERLRTLLAGHGVTTA